MTTLPLGLGAYTRKFAGEVEIELINRYVEKNPTNLKEGTALIARPGNHLLNSFDGGPSGHIRACISKIGLFNSDLFISSGPNVYRYDGTTKTLLNGTLSGTDAPRYAWMKGIGYEYLFLSDGTHLYYYAGAGNAIGQLVYSGSGVFASDIVEIEGVCYSWGTNMTDPLANGTLAHPYVCVANANPLNDLTNMLNFSGTPGVTFSSTLVGPNTNVTASISSDFLTMTVTAIVEGAAGNSITTTLGAGASGHIAWGDVHLNGGGVNVLNQVAVPDAQSILALTALAGFVIVAVGGTQKMYFVRPGATAINALDFAEKEQNPDPIQDLATVGDVMVVAGTGSTEYWYATGDSNEPFAPIQGRAKARGIVAGTLVVLDDSSYAAVGNDGRCYLFNPSPTPISDHGIEERIRTQIRREAGIL